MKHRSSLLAFLAFSAETFSIGIYVTCFDIIYLFDRCFPLSAVRCVLTCRKGGFFGKLKVLPLFRRDSVSDF